MTIREFIWERCEGNDKKTDEIIQHFLEQLPKEKDRNRESEGEDDFNLGFNACLKQIKQSLGDE